MLNNTFKTEDDILNTLNVPLIGIIPEVDGKEFNKS
jgi:capsular polysaccharide biosynthesis protein